MKNIREKIYIGASSIALTALVLGILIILGVIFFRGITVFYPKEISLFELKDGTKLLGSIRDEKTEGSEEIVLIELGNRDINGQGYRWINKENITSSELAQDAVYIERLENGKFIGFLGNDPGASSENLQEALDKSIDEAEELLEKIHPINDDINEFTDSIRALEKTLKDLDFENTDPNDEEYVETEKELQIFREKSNQSYSELLKLNGELDQIRFPLRTQENKILDYPVAGVVQYYFPNQLGVIQKLWIYLKNFYTFLFTWPRESNTEGGILPAIIGTLTMVILMSIFAFPLGVITAIYMKEYAGKGWFLQTLRIAVNNLAGVPSIVFGVFGLGFFIYGLGGTIDELFYPERLPEPTFGTGGLLWASLTLSVLTVPVVIVSTEEALSAVPLGLRHASLALGATRLQTLVRVVIPKAMPGIITGFILAISRAAGEVAPLMVTGIVKLAPELPIDGTFPFIHLERKIMHLGFHIYDLGFQSPDTESAKPMVFVTTMILLLMVILLNATAIYFRERILRNVTNKDI